MPTLQQFVTSLDDERQAIRFFACVLGEFTIDIRAALFGEYPDSHDIERIVERLKGFNEISHHVTAHLVQLTTPQGSTWTSATLFEHMTALGEVYGIEGYVERSCRRAMELSERA